MSAVLQLLDILKNRNITLRLNGDGNLLIDGDKSALDPALIDTIKGTKQALVAYLTRQQAGPPAITRLGDSHTALLASFAQQRMWLLDQIHGGSAHYNMPGVFKLSGKLDLALMRAALGDIVARHEPLRTCFESGSDGLARQRINPPQPFDLPLHDFSHLHGGEQQLRVSEAIAREASRAFDLSLDLMLRALLLKTGPDCHVLLVTMHHIAADGWSLAILMNEFSALYQAGAHGLPNPLPPLPVSYADYAHWQHTHMQAAMLEDQLRYWRQQLANLPALHRLPLDFARPPQQTHAGATHRSVVDASLLARLGQLCQSQGATLFMGLHAAFAILLARYSNETDIVMGSPIANREQAELAGLIGFFVNTLVLRSELAIGSGFVDVLKQSKRVLLEAYEAQQVPFEQIAESLQQVRSTSHSPLFQIMLVLQNNRQGSITLPGLQVEALEQNHTIAKFDLTLNVSTSAQGWTLAWEYNTDLFEAATIGRMARHFGHLLETMLLAPTADVFALDMLSTTEHAQWLAACSGPNQAYPAQQCIHTLFEQQAASQPDAVALRMGEAQLSYGELNAQANRLAHFLLEHALEHAVTSERLIGICAERSLTWVVGILGILKAGAAYVPLDPDYPAQRLAYMLADARLEQVITQSHLRQRLPATVRQLWALDDAAMQNDLAQQPANNPDLAKLGLNAHHLAYVIYTSGSSGQPKGVMIEHRSLCNLVRFDQQLFGLGPDSRLLNPLSPGFDAGNGYLWDALCSGAQLLLHAPDQTLFDVIDAEQITHAVLPAALLQVQTIRPCAQLEVLISGGDVCNSRILSQLHERTRFYNVYGPTENTVTSTVQQIQQGETPGIGCALANMQAYVLSPALAPVPPGCEGELHLGGVGLARGYWQRPELTAEKFIANPFHDPDNPASSARLYKTGDRVRYNRDGNLEFLGRIDQQLKIRGFRIEPGEIEAVLCRHPLVREALVLAQAGNMAPAQPGSGLAGVQTQLVGYVLLNDAALARFDLNHAADTAELHDELCAHIRHSLPDYMVPNAMVALTEWPLTTNGKVDRRALPQPKTAPGAPHYQPPANALEQLLCEIWQNVLQRERVGASDHFFQLGGHSLLLMQVIAQLQAQGWTMSARQMFTTPVLRDLAAALAQSPVPARLALKAAPCGIPEACQHITTAMLPMLNLPQSEIDNIVAQVAGGAANIQDIYPLSPLQQGILFHHMGSSESDPYLMPVLFRIADQAKLTRFLDAMRFVIARHDVLRSMICWQDLATPVQVVCRQVELPLNWPALPAGQEVQAHMQALCASPKQWISLNQAPLLRLQAAPDTSSSQYFVLLQIHHMVADHVGLEIIQKEMMAFQNGHADSLPVPLQYREFVAHAAQQADQDQAEAFFRANLADVEEPTLPFNLADVQGDGSRTLQAHARLAATQAQQIRRLARHSNISPAALFHAAWALVVARCSGRDDVVFGTVLSGRLQGMAGADNMLGVFINTLPLRVRQTSMPVDALLRQVQHSLQELLPYEQAALALAQRCSALPGAVPLFSALLNYRHSDPASQEAQAGSFALSGVELVSAIERTNYPFTLMVDDSADGFALTAQVDSSLDPLRLIDHMQAAIAGLLQAHAAAPDQAPAALTLMPAAEIRQILHQWNDTASVFPEYSSIHALFEAQAAAKPDAIALMFEDQCWRYDELNRRANQLAHYLIQHQQLRPDTLVGICLERSPEMMIGMLAVLKAGAAYVPLDPDYPQQRLAYMLEHAQLHTVLTQRHLAARTPVSPAQALYLDDPQLQQQLASHSQHNIAPAAIGLQAQHLAYVIYTSGSTGQPKGVMIEHRSVLNFLTSMARQPGIDAQDCLLALTSTSFDIHVLELFLPLTHGASLVLASRAASTQPDQLLALLQRHPVTLLQATPATWKMLIDANWQQTTPLKALCGGEALSPQLAQALLQQPGLELWNMYGPTETTVWSCVKRILPDQPVLMGGPIGNTRFYVLAANGSPAPVGVAGELWIGGAGLARGYLHRPDLSAERFIANPFYQEANQDANPSSNPSANRSDQAANSLRLYQTGDLVRWRADGSIEFLGRIDHQVKIRGFRIELGEIENALCRHPEVKDAVVMARTMPSGTQQLVAYIVLAAESDAATNASTGDPETPPLSTRLRQHLGQTLPDYMQPAAWVCMPAWPLTPNGKIDRKALPAPDAQSVQDGYLAPRNDVEQTLCHIWQQVLGVARVGISDNFFTLGGDSIVAIRIISQTRQAGYKITAGELFAAQTIQALTPHLLALSQPGAAAMNPAENSLADTSLTQPDWLAQAHRPPANMRAGVFPLAATVRFLHFNQGWGSQFNASLTLSLEHYALRLDWLERAIYGLLLKHPALQCQFIAQAAQLEMVWAPVSSTTPLLQIEDMRQIAPDEFEAQFLTRWRHWQNSFSFDGNSNLFRFVYFQCGPDRPDRLLLIFQHMLIDGESSKILLDDLLQNYLRIEQGQALPAASTGPNYWDWLANYDALMLRSKQADQAYWRQLDWNKLATLNVSSHPLPNQQRAPEPVLLDATTTAQLLQLRMDDAGERHNLFMDAIFYLLTQAIAPWLTDEMVLMETVAHNRWLLGPEFDTRELVGNLTSNNVIPLMVPAASKRPMSPASMPAMQAIQTIQAIHTRRKQVPNEGRGLIHWLYSEHGFDDIRYQPLVGLNLVFHESAMVDTGLAARFAGAASSVKPIEVGDTMVRDETNPNIHALFFRVTVYADAIKINLYPNPQRCPNSLANAITARLQQGVNDITGIQVEKSDGNSSA